MRHLCLISMFLLATMLLMMMPESRSGRTYFKSSKKIIRMEDLKFTINMKPRNMLKRIITLGDLSGITERYIIVNGRLR